MGMNFPYYCNTIYLITIITIIIFIIIHIFVLCQSPTEYNPKGAQHYSHSSLRHHKIKIVQ